MLEAIAAYPLPAVMIIAAFGVFCGIVLVCCAVVSREADDQFPDTLVMDRPAAEGDAS